MVKNVLIFIAMLPVILAGWAISATVTGAVMGFMVMMAILSLPMLLFYSIGNWICGKPKASPSASPAGASSPADTAVKAAP